MFGSALAFDGTGFVTIANSASLNLASSMTLEAWVFPTATPTDWSTVLLKEQTGALVYTLYAGSPFDRPHAKFNTSSDNSGERSVRGSSGLALNTWTHLAGTYDGATLSLYLNGTLVATEAFSGAIVTSTGALRIGGNSVWGEFFRGRIDEVRIYNRALSQAEVQADMNTSATGAPPDITPPTAPTGLTATAASTSQINIAWTASTDNVAVTGYRVERCQGAGCTSFAQIATPTATSFNDTGLTTATSYSYRVRAADAAG